MDIREEAMKLREEKHQMIKTTLNAKMEDLHDLAVVYTPGVAAPCLAIKEEEDKSLELTWRGNVVAVISDGTRVLGLGDIGAAAAMPVMEGKALFIKSLVILMQFRLLSTAKIKMKSYIQSNCWKNLLQGLIWKISLLLNAMTLKMN